MFTVSQNGSVVARDAANGARLWSVAGEFGWQWQSRLVGGHLLLRGPDRATVVDVADAGTVEWRARTSVGSNRTIDIREGDLRFDGETVYVQAGGGVYAVNITGGDAAAGALSSPPTVRLVADT